MKLIRLMLHVLLGSDCGPADRLHISL